MKKYKCECKSAKCEVEREDKVKPEYCTCFCTKKAEWKEVKEKKDKEFPSWCKVGEVVYFTKLSKYCKILDIDTEKGIKIQTDLSKGWVVNFYDLLEARLRPFNEKEMRELVGKVIANKTTKTRYLIVTSNSTSVSAAGYIYNKEELLNGFIFTDGSPCGVYEHFENGEWVK